MLDATLGTLPWPGHVAPVSTFSARCACGFVPVPRRDAAGAPVPRCDAASAPVACREAASTLPTRHEADSAPRPRPEAAGAPLSCREAAGALVSLCKADTAPVLCREAAGAPILCRRLAGALVSHREAASAPVPRREAANPHEQTNANFILFLTDWTKQSVSIWCFNAKQKSLILRILYVSFLHDLIIYSRTAAIFTWCVRRFVRQNSRGDKKAVVPETCHRGP